MVNKPVIRTLLKSLVGVVVMFLFAIFIMPPLYDVFCEVTGIGGKTSGRYEAEIAGVDESRTIRVQFVATNNGEMSWDFKPTVYEVKVHPGQPTPVTFYARNTTDRDMIAQAIPNVVPNNAAQYFHKTECFCFNQQPLDAGESVEMPLVFIVDPELPEHITKLTLSYTLYDQDPQARVSGSARAGTTTNNNG